MEKISFLKNKKAFIPILLIVFFSVVSAFCLIMLGDDFVWYYVYDIEDLYPFQNPNGRYLTNKITYFMVKSPIVSCSVFSVAFSMLIILTSCLADFEKKSSYLKYALSFSFVILMPKEIYANVINWISGFTNYVLSFLFIILYIFYCMRIAFDKNYTPNKLWSIFVVILGFAGALCVEHVTIYNILFGIFAVIFIYKCRKCFYISNILYLLSAIAGAVFMFFAGNYTNIAVNGGDSISLRHIDFNLSDIFMQLYRLIIPNYSKQFFAIHIIILFCFWCIYYKSDKSTWNLSRKRYVKICVIVLIIYSVYSVFTNCFNDLIVLNMNMKVRALETAFTFVYFVALIYLSTVLLEKNSCIRFIIYIISTVASVLPFLVVHPITPRCFFTDYMFWILATGELFFACYKYLNFFRSAYFHKLFSVASIILGCFMLNINITNKYCENLRIEYIKSQIENKSRIVQIIKLPYADYAYDGLDKEDLFETNFMIDYSDLFFKYYGIDVDKDNFNYIFIDMIDYCNANDF